MSIAEMKLRYERLCAKRDLVNRNNEPLEADLARINAQVCELQAQAHAIAAKIDDNRGREKWVDLKKEIAFLARAMAPGR
jgi:hypothetical protein